MTAPDLEARYLHLVREYLRPVERLAATYERDPARREDLVQEIWLALWRALPSFRGDCSERTFVYRIAHNRGVTHIEHWMLRKTEELSEDLPVIDHREDPEGDAIARQRGEALRAAVRQLPLAQRQVVSLALEGLPHRDIAEILGLTENNVAVRLNRARARLATTIGRQGDPP
jgi:RNA polymerase sigma factor (sigma-70 family)